MIEIPENRVFRWDIDVDMDWIYDRHKERTVGMVAKLLHKDEWPKLRAYTQFIETLFPFPLKDDSLFTAWLDQDNVNPKDPDWCRGFPHCHNNRFTTTSVVIQAPIAGGETMVSGVTYKPVVGQGLIINGNEFHGVRRIIGDVPRIAVIAQFTRR